MNIAFFISSIGDTDLALATIKSLENKGHKLHLIPLTKTAHQRIESIKNSSNIVKTTLFELMELNPQHEIGDCLTLEQLKLLNEYINKNFDHAFIGVPSTNIDIPFQIAEQIEHMPVLIAYEFMFKPPAHKLWSYLPRLKAKPNVQWAVPLATARQDFGDASTVPLMGHLSIDNAYKQNPPVKTTAEIKSALQIEQDYQFGFLSSTTQPVETDLVFIEHLLAELPNHPTMQVRLGLHPGIQDLDAYLSRILTLNSKLLNAKQFKIIVPDNLVTRLKKPELTIDNPLFSALFLRVNINGNEAAYAADRVAQAVPGALLNQAAIEGKPAYSHSGTPYLPKHYFTNNINQFFSASLKPLRTKNDLGLDNLSAGECSARILLTSLTFKVHYAAAIRKIKQFGPGSERIIEAMNRLEAGKNNRWNPYWMNSGKKLERIIHAIEQMNTSDTLEELVNNPESELYRALNLQRITPVTFLGKIGLYQTKTLQFIQEDAQTRLASK